MSKLIEVPVLVNRILGFVAHMEEGLNACKILVLTAEKEIGDLGICRWIVLGWISKK